MILAGFTGDGVTSADELKKKPVEELAKINPWDDEKTRKMKMRLAMMHSDNQAIRDDIQQQCALKARCVQIFTRNPTHYDSSLIAVLPPAAFMGT